MTVIVNSASAPTAGSPVISDLLTMRLANRCTGTAAEALLSPGAGSGVSDVTAAEFDSVAPACAGSSVPRTVIVQVAPGSRKSSVQPTARFGSTAHWPPMSEVASRPAASRALTMSDIRTP